MERRDLYRLLEQQTDSKVICYVTSDRIGAEAQIDSQVLPRMVEHLDTIRDADRICLVLHTAGGDVSASWSISRLLRQFCRELLVVVPYRAHSGGTLISLGADRVIMTRQATLSPIDPSVTHLLGPRDRHQVVSVSVEDLNAFVDVSKREVGLHNSSDCATILQAMVHGLHPLVIGSAYRRRQQIRMLGEQLLRNQMPEEHRRQKVLAFLCSDSGAHDHKIFRQGLGTSWV